MAVLRVQSHLSVLICFGSVTEMQDIFERQRELHVVQFQTVHHSGQHSLVFARGFVTAIDACLASRVI